MVSRAVQPAIHDVTHSSALRAWFDPPLIISLSAELYNTQSILWQVAAAGALLFQLPLYPSEAAPTCRHGQQGGAAGHP